MPYKLCQILDNTEYVLGIEFLNACQAVELNAALRLSPRTAKVLRDCRRVIPAIDRDVVMSELIDAARSCVVEHGARWAEGLV